MESYYMLSGIGDFMLRKSSFPDVADMLVTLRKGFDKKLSELSDLEVAQLYAAETDTAYLSADDCKELFVSFCKEAVEALEKIDKATPGNDHMIEPKWWVEMMNLQRRLRANAQIK